MLKTLLICWIPAVVTLSRAAVADYIDTIAFGATVSEQSHGFTQVRSEIIHGGLGEPARRLLPLDPISYNGGSLSFRLKVDPQQ
jgi:hypothetical protein